MRVLHRARQGPAGSLLHHAGVERRRREITTLEGLGTVEKPHPIQKAFVDEQAIQCGFCLSGVMLTAKAALDANPQATDAQLRQALATVLCRAARIRG